MHSGKLVALCILLTSIAAWQVPELCLLSSQPRTGCIIPAYSREVSRAVRRQKSKFSEYHRWPHFSPGPPGAWCPDQPLYTEAEHNGDCVETVWRLCVDADCFYEFLIYYLRPLTAAGSTLLTPPRSDNLFLWII